MRNPVDPGGLPVGTVIVDADGVVWSVAFLDFKRFDEDNNFKVIYAATVPGPYTIYSNPWG